MDEMKKKRNGRERMFNLFYDLKDLLSDLEGRNNNSSKHLKELKTSINRMFTEFKEQLRLVNVDKDELRLIRKLKAEVQEALT